MYFVCLTASLTRQTEDIMNLSCSVGLVLSFLILSQQILSVVKPHEANRLYSDVRQLQRQKTVSDRLQTTGSKIRHRPPGPEGQ